jgi:putative restriction endonuclease
MDQLRGYVGNTDYDWYRCLRDLSEPPDEVNFWQPSGKRRFRAIQVGAPFFFRLKQPHCAIAGFGLFASSQLAPAWLAWRSFGVKNGAQTYTKMVRRIARYNPEMARLPVERAGNAAIGCIMIAQPYFFPEDDWIEEPRGWQKPIVQGKTYSIAEGEGARIYGECLRRTQWEGPFADDAEGNRHGSPVLVVPRLGQGIFRMRVVDAYASACAVTREHSLPVLEAAHIKPFSQDGAHSVRNGLLLRADLHRLYDAGYMTVTGDHQVRVSEALTTEYHNGREYLRLAGRNISLPERAENRPDRELLAWHAEAVFRG